MQHNFASTGRSTSTEPEPLHPWAVLVGPDCVGKSSVLRELATRGRSVVSYDDDMLESRYAVLSQLRRALDTALQGGVEYSADFLIAGLSLVTFYLRDEMQRRRHGASVLVDSYHYKVAAKCRIFGLDRGRTNLPWQNFPQPDLVIMLRTEDEVLWARASRRTWLNRFEHHGRCPERESFVSLQRELVASLRELARGVPLVEVDAGAPLAEVCDRVEDALRGVKGA
jgi:thymidylate kinase